MTELLTDLYKCYMYSHQSNAVFTHKPQFVEVIHMISLLIQNGLVQESTKSPEVNIVVFVF